MPEQKLQQALNEATGFVRRQRLLKQLWKLRKQREAKAPVTSSTEKRRSSKPPLRVAPKRAESMAT